MDTAGTETTETPCDEKLKELVRKHDLVIFTCTYYNDVNDLRFRQCLRTLKDTRYGSSAIPIVVVDGSPMEVHNILKSISGAIVYREQKRFGKGKGGALREAAMAASSLPGTTESTLLCWQEAEKSDMNRCWIEEVLPQCQLNDDVICPTRDDDCFRQSYPTEQYHSENFGNHYLNCVMKKELLEKDGEQRYGIDWHFGPFAFRRSLLYLWMDYKGTSYDAQLIPIVAAIRKGLKVNHDVQVTFKLDEKMKQQEEGSLNFIEKRLYQLNDLDPKVKKFWGEPLYC